MKVCRESKNILAVDGRYLKTGVATKRGGYLGPQKKRVAFLLPCCLFAFRIASRQNFIHTLRLMVVFFLFFFFVAFLLFTIDLTEASLVDSHQSSYGGSGSTEPAGPFIILAV